MHDIKAPPALSKTPDEIKFDTWRKYVYLKKRQQSNNYKNIEKVNRIIIYQSKAIIIYQSKVRRKWWQLQNLQITMDD